MHYIINPWLFYLLDVTASLILICLLFVVIFTLAFGAYTLVWLIEIKGECDEENYPNPKSILRKFMIPLIFSIAFLIFVLSSDTIYKMLIASQITTENIDNAKETIQDVSEYIVDAVNGIKEKEDD